MQCVFKDADKLKKGETVSLILQSHPGLGLVKKYGAARSAGEWRYIESGVCHLRGSGEEPVRVRCEDGNFMRVVDSPLVFDISFWKIEKGNTVNFVGHESDTDVEAGGALSEKTKAPGGGRDFTINDDGTVSSKSNPDLVLGVKVDPVRLRSNSRGRLLLMPLS